MFLQWCIENDLVSDEMKENYLEKVIAPVKTHMLTGAEVLWSQLDGKLISDDLSDEGTIFADNYYSGGTEFSTKYGEYTADYARAVKKLEENGVEYETLYHFEDTYEHYLLVKPVIDDRFRQWKEEYGYGTARPVPPRLDKEQSRKKQSAQPRTSFLKRKLLDFRKGKIDSRK